MQINHSGRVIIGTVRICFHALSFLFTATMLTTTRTPAASASVKRSAAAAVTTTAIAAAGPLGAASQGVAEEAVGK